MWPERSLRAITVFLGVFVLVWLFFYGPTKTEAECRRDTCSGGPWIDCQCEEAIPYGKNPDCRSVGTDNPRGAMHSCLQWGWFGKPLEDSLRLHAKVRMQWAPEDWGTDSFSVLVYTYGSNPSISTGLFQYYWEMGCNKYTGCQLGYYTKGNLRENYCDDLTKECSFDFLSPLLPRGFTPSYTRVIGRRGYYFQVTGSDLPTEEKFYHLIDGKHELGTSSCGLAYPFTPITAIIPMVPLPLAMLIGAKRRKRKDRP